MKIKMTESIQGSLDGVTVRELTEGVEYDTVDTAVGARLAQAHIWKGVAVAADPIPEAVSPVLAKAPRTK